MSSVVALRRFFAGVFARRPIVPAADAGATPPGAGLARRSGQVRVGIRRLGLGSLGLICVIAALQARIHAHPALRAADSERQRALEQTTALLNMAPAQSAGIVPFAPSYAPAGNGEPPLMPGGDPQGVTSPMAGADSSRANAPSAPPATRPVRAMPWADAAQRPDGFPETLRGEPLPARPPVPPEDRREPPPNESAVTIAKAPSVHVRAAHVLIPQKIEAPPLLPALGDPLSGLEIVAGLRVLDETAAPFRMVAIRQDAGRLQAQIALRNAPEHGGPAHEWLAAGQTTPGGWYLASLSIGDGLFLSPHGNPLRLRLAHEPGAGASLWAPPDPVLGKSNGARKAP